MAWLSGYAYRKKGIVNATTAGAQSNYQLTLVIGESSGASGEDVDCANLCQNFPNDIRFTNEDGRTKHDYWIGATEGSTPNRKATATIEVASIPASGTVNLFMYYGNPTVSSESNIVNTFIREIDSGQPVIGAWALNDTALDSSGNSNDGSLNGGMGYTTGKFGQAALFDGVDDYINCGTNACLNITSAITIEAWVKSGGNPSLAPIITKGCLLDAYALNIRNDLLQFVSYKTRYIAYTFTPGTWYHVAGTFGDGYTRIYINGTEEYSMAETGAINTNASPLCLGWDQDNVTPTPHFDGVIDEGKLYDRVLTADEISDLYGTGGDRYGYTTTTYPGKVLVCKYASPVPTWGAWGNQQYYERGFYYAKLGSTILTGLETDSFRITEELDKIPSYEFEIANCSDNRTTIAAGITDVFKIYHRLWEEDTLMFTGIINGDSIEYLSLERIRITGYASFIDLNWRFHQHLNSADAETVDKVYNYTGSYSDKTTEANNDTINDVPITYSSINDALYIGQGEQFFGMQIKYSTKGVQAASTTVVWEYSKGSSVWATLDVLDETRAFTEAVGTHYITIPHKPSDWAKDTVNSVKKFWIRARLSAGSYTTSPALDRIKMTNVDVYRVYYFETAADTIMTDVLAGTGYSMDVTDVCPSDTISIVAEYETKLRIIAGIANALTWDDSGDKKAYQWWIDTSKKVHFKQKRGATLGDITADLTILNNIEDYFNLSNRLHFLGNYEGHFQLKAVIEDTSSQDTHEIRELAVPEERFNNYIPLKEAAQKAMTYTKAPLQKIAATVTTKYWLDNAFEVGDTVTLHKDTWDVDSTAFQIVRADIGPRVTNLDMGISQEHLDGLKAGLQRQLDITGIRMHGSTSVFQIGPLNENYHRVDAGTVYPSRLKIEIPANTRYIHKVLLSWKIEKYKSSVEGGGETTGHDHTGTAGAGGAFTPAVLDGGAHTPTELGDGEHTHTDTGITLAYSSYSGYVLSATTTGTEATHTHPKGRTGVPDDTRTVIGGEYGEWDWGSACTTGSCVDSVTGVDVAEQDHWHLNTGMNTGSGSSHSHSLSTYALGSVVMAPISISIFSISTDLDHTHTINCVADHPHTGVAEPAHSDHTIVTEAAADVDLAYGVYEEAAGTLLELIIGGETVGSSYSGDQTDINITGFLTSGSNTVLLQPIVTEVGKKGSATFIGSAFCFYETK